VNPNYVASAGLQNYWTFCSSLTDLITNLTLYSGVNATLVPDKNGISSAALSLSNGYVRAPNGVYFDGGDYTIMAWVYPRSFNSWSKILEFGNGESNRVVCVLSSGITGIVNHRIYNGTSESLYLSTNQPLQLNKWQHLSFTFSNSTLKAFVYLNGSLMGSANAAISPNNVVRTSNYFGKSIWASNGLADAVFDEIKLFSIALNQSQIQFEMKNEYYAHFSNQIVQVTSTQASSSIMTQTNATLEVLTSMPTISTTINAASNYSSEFEFFL
jgi:hypothetical protein